MLDPQFDWRSNQRLAQIEVNYLVTQDPYNGRDPIVTHVPWTTHSHASLFGFVIREQNFFPCRALVVFAVMDDGERVGKAVEIPDPTKTREVIVTLP